MGTQAGKSGLQGAATAVQQARGYECAVCLDAVANTFLLPCAHLLCAGCAEQQQRCPTCRTAVQERRRFYA
jgi:hypothetical protein